MTTSQHFLPIEDIKDDLVFLKDGGVSLVMSTSAVNFDLLFENEQISLIESFAGLLNSLSFAIQIVIASQRLDVSSYLKTLDAAIKKQTNSLLAKMTTSYRIFVASIIKENNVLDKQFYVVLNVSGFEFGVLPKDLSERSKKATIILNPRRDHLIRQLNRLGLKAKQLTTSELISLFYNIYNPAQNGNNEIKNIQPQPIQAPTSQPPKISPLPVSVLPKPTPPQPVTGNILNLTPPFVVEELADDGP